MTSMEQRRILRTTGWVLLAIGAVAAVGALVMRDQIERHRRELFSSHPLRRLAALGYLGGLDPSVETVRLLRDFLAWEPRPLLRRRATLILARMERRLQETVSAQGGVAG
ncbi:MAG TPA: hypothetical protein VFQ38_18080 [Longimicrobiales bacterium]|nr:hypothetical protein [Longimicrobiales bacterium]